MMHDFLEVEISSQSVVINGGVFQSQVTSEEYESILGSDYRVYEYGPPAPYGHTNNKALIFDCYGIYLFQHHSTKLIRGITFVYQGNVGAVSVNRTFGGSLEIFDHVIPSKPKVGDIPEPVIKNGVRFENIYNLKLDNIAISFELGNDNQVIRAIEATYQRIEC